MGNEKAELQVVERTCSSICTERDRFNMPLYFVYKWQCHLKGLFFCFPILGKQPAGTAGVDEKNVVVRLVETLSGPAY